MVTYILDASGALRYIDNEEGAVRVGEILQSGLRGHARVLISAIHWGEIAGVIHRRFGIATMQKVLVSLLASGIELVAVTSEHAVRAIVIKNDFKIPYADAFGVVLTQDLTQSVLITGDFDFKPAEQMISIEFLPQKPTPSQKP
jgi:predicted nucleic acid-binding protein